MSILHALWIDGIDFTRCQILEDKEFRKQQIKQSKRIEQFINTLSEEQIAALMKIEEEENTLRAQLEESTFIQSFKWGAQMMLEILS